MRKLLTLAVIGAVSVSVILGAFSGNQAWAAGLIRCAAINGNLSGTVALSGCSGASNTAGGSQPFSTTALLNGPSVSITWLSGKTTTLQRTALQSVRNARRCPGYVKGAPVEPSAKIYEGRVTADTSGLMVFRGYKGGVCISTSGVITAFRPLTVS